MEEKIYNKLVRDNIIDGVEVYYSAFTNEQIEYLKEYSLENKLIYLPEDNVIYVTENKFNILGDSNYIMFENGNYIIFKNK